MARALRCFVGSGVKTIVASSDPHEPTLWSRHAKIRVVIDAVVFPADCLVMCGKDTRVTAQVGCSAEHDALLTCALSHSDPCELNFVGCAAEDEALLECALD